MRKRTRKLDIWTQSLGSEEAVTIYFGCLEPGGATRIIARTENSLEGGDALEHLHAAAPFLAFTVSNGSKYGGGEALETFDLRTGRAVFNITTEDYGSDYESNVGELPVPALERLGSPVGRGVRSFVLNAHGAVAWVGSVPQAVSQQPQRVLYLHDRSGTHEVAAARDLHELAFRGSRLTWVSEGVVHSVSTSA